MQQPSLGQDELEVEEARALQPAADSVASLLQVLEDYASGYLRVAPHQRTANAWDEGKRRRYVDRLRKADPPPGFFATYQLIGDRAGITFLNDGWQRFTTLRMLRASPSRYGMSDAGVRSLLRQKISVQHRHFLRHEDAMQDFQHINAGTTLTPYELCRGYLIYMDGWEEMWGGLVGGVESAVAVSESRLRAKIIPSIDDCTESERQQRHKLDRHTLALFYRFITGDKAHAGYPDVPRSTINGVAEETLIEVRLRGVLEQMGYEEACKWAERFRLLVNQETALVEDVRPKGMGLSPSLHRWFLDAAIWRRNNRRPVDLFRQFVVVLRDARYLPVGRA